MARRLLIYMMIGSLVVLGLGILEWLDKRTLSSIERARLLGPQFQPNGFAAFLVIGSVPFIAVLVSNLSRWWAWSIVPSLVMFVRVLLATFSRGAYIGFGVVCIFISYLRGTMFVTLLIAGCVGVYAFAPELIPESLVSRVEQSTGGGGGFSEDLDNSSQTRLILWKAAIDMTLESPIIGTGFGMFPYLKGRYTEVPVAESDNHNMFLYICSQMGVPALLVFVLIFGRMFILGFRLHRAMPDPFGRTIGMTAAATVAGTIGVNMFGSRMVDISVMMYFWVLLAVTSHLWVEQEQRVRASSLAAAKDAVARRGSRLQRAPRRPLGTQPALRKGG
jgi:O-antigen ligase